MAVSERLGQDNEFPRSARSQLGLIDPRAPSNSRNRLWDQRFCAGGLNLASARVEGVDVLSTVVMTWSNPEPFSASRYDRWPLQIYRVTTGYRCSGYW